MITTFTGIHWPLDVSSTHWPYCVNTLTSKLLFLADCEITYYNKNRLSEEPSKYRVAQKSKLLILAVDKINASQTRVSFAKFIPKLVEKMFDMCSIVPNYSFSILKFFIEILIFFTNFTHNNDLKYNTQLDRYEIWRHNCTA